MSLLIDVLNLVFASWAALATSLEFCSSACTVFVLISKIYFVVSFTCCTVILYASRFANTKLFVVLNAATVLYAILLTNLLYACANDLGDV